MRLIEAFAHVLRNTAWSLILAAGIWSLVTLDGFWQLAWSNLGQVFSVGAFGMSCGCGCTSTNCVLCCPNGTGTTVKVTLSGFGTTGNCATCDTLYNGDFFLPVAVSFPTCHWHKRTIFNGVCGVKSGACTDVYMDLDLNLTSFDATHCKVQVRANIASTGFPFCQAPFSGYYNDIFWDNTTDMGKPDADCQSYTLGFVSYSASDGGTGACSYSSGSVTVDLNP